MAEIGSMRGPAAAAGAVSAAGMASALATGFGAFGLARRVRMGVVLTDRRLIFVAADQMTGKMLDVASEGPRSSVARGPVKSKIYLSYDLLDAKTGEPIVKLSYPVPARSIGQQIADALPERVQASS
ncbi:MAG TPA: hypothetical protein VHF47_01085 [Acidimicrobiales bacterium]|nr:hypothetical protein [Acidimicrobiales bacterium]